jgi:hypothetical protein
LGTNFVVIGLGLDHLPPDLKRAEAGAADKAA